MDTIKTIQDLLKLNGSAQSATVKLTEKTKSLIASAPELLRACKGTSRVLRQRLLKRELTQDEMNIMHIAEQAIAKAEGLKLRRFTVYHLGFM